MVLNTRGRVRSVQRASKNLQKETWKAPIPHDQANPAVFRHAADSGVSCCRREPITCRTDPGRHGAAVDSRHARAGRRGCLRLGLDRARRSGRGRHHRRRALPALTAALTTAAARAPTGAATPAAASSTASPSAVSRAPAGATAAARTGARATGGRRARARTATGRAAAGEGRRGPGPRATVTRSVTDTFAAPSPATATAAQGGSAGGSGTARVQGAGPQAADEQHVGRDAHAAAHGARGPRRRHPSPPFPLADGDPCRNGLS